MKSRIVEDAAGRRRAAEPCLAPCPIEQGMRILGGKWTGSILWHLRDAPVRFNDLARMIGGASKKMIAERLRHLEGYGLIRREIVHSAPVSVRYSITDDSRLALAALDGLRAWAERLEPGAPVSAG